jgi:hypothetical protein
MANYYVRSGASGSATGASWANAYTTLASAVTGKSAGDIIYVAADHAEASASAITITPAGTTQANPMRIVCVDHTGSVPPVAADLRTTATITTSATSQILIQNYVDVYGIEFSANNDITLMQATTQNVVQRYTNCKFTLNNSGTAHNIRLGNNSVTSSIASGIVWDNVQVSFSNTGQYIFVFSALEWRNTPNAVIGAAVPNTLFNPAGPSGRIDIRGVDLSALGSGKIIAGNAFQATATVVTLTNCKVDPAATKVGSSSTARYNALVDFINCHNSGTATPSIYRKRQVAVLTEELTVYRTGGATDGTTPYAWKIVTGSYVGSWPFPFECPPIAAFNDTTGASRTLTIEGTGSAIPNDDEVWVEVDYLGDASSPRATTIHDSRATVLTAAAAQTSSAATWGGGSAPFKLQVTFTPRQKGLVYARVKVNKASSTFYIDPKITLS